MTVDTRCSTQASRAELGVDTFMAGLAKQESGDPKAINKDTGALGAYQIMPRNWYVWAKQAGADVNDYSLDNQRKVVRAKLTSYYLAFDSWDSVARAWYSGPANAHRHSDHKEGRYPSINAYAASVLAKAGPLPCS